MVVEPSNLTELNGEIKSTSLSGNCETVDYDNYYHWDLDMPGEFRIHRRPGPRRLTTRP